MKNNIYIKAGFLILICFAFSAERVVAQRKKLTAKENNSINASAKEQFDLLKEYLNQLCDKSNDMDTKESIISQMIEHPDNVFVDGNTMVESDLDPVVTKSGGTMLVAKEYLHNFCLSFIANQTPGVDFEIMEISPLRTPQNSDVMYLKITFKEILNGTDKSGKPHNGKKYRVATFTVSQSNGKWKTYINNLSFDNGATDAGSFVTITDENEVNVQDVVVKPESYYRYLIVKGNNALKDNNYTDAYLAFNEATNSKLTEKDAKTKIEELKNKMKSKSIYECSAEWNRVLKIKAPEYEKNHRYEEAYRCYSYAYDLISTDKTLLPKIQEMKNKVDIQNKLEGLYKSNQYEVAIKEYTNEINIDNKNPYLYIGRAKNYAKIGIKETDARRDFNKAIALDKTIPEIYKWQGLFFENLRNPNYKDASTAFSLYVNYFEDKSDPELVDFYCELSFLNGMIKYIDKSYAAALDSFKAICKVKPNFERAILFQGLCYMYLKDNEKAKERIDEALTINPKFAEAHYWKGKLLIQNNTKDGQEGYINELKSALTYDVNNCQWNFDLAYELQNKAIYKDAIVYYKNCIESNGPQSTTALYYRGKCLYKLNSYDEALNDYLESAKRGLLLQPNYFVDLGFVYLIKGDASKAIENFNKGNNTAEAFYGLGEAYFLQNPGNSSLYIDAFENAFKKGISKDVINYDPFLSKLNDVSEFQKLRKKYKK